MKLKNLQIVSFNNPFPPNYGGVIDVFYKIKYLHQLNIGIHLHIYYDDRIDINQLKPFCKKIYQYKRNKSLFKLASKIPFSVGSRSSKEIYNNLSKIDAPILFEGLQSTHVLIRNSFKNKTIIRNHNIEHSYYFGLARSETNYFFKWIYWLEGIKLKKYERIVNKVDILLPLSNFEFEYFKQNYTTEVSFLPVFHGLTSIFELTKKGDYALYHGDLSTSDNQKSVKFLISVFAKLKETLFIAGSTISKTLSKEIEQYDNIHYKKLGKDSSLLDALIAKAHINILHSNQQSGTKLKIFYSLFRGRHCIVNSNITDDNAIRSLCGVAETKEEYIEAVKKHFQKDYILSDLKKKTLLKYVPLKTASQLVEILNK